MKKEEIKLIMKRAVELKVQPQVYMRRLLIAAVKKEIEEDPDSQLRGRL